MKEHFVRLIIFTLTTFGSFAQAPVNVVAWGDNSQGQTNVPPFLTNAVAVSVSGYLNLALTEDGRVVQWGWGKPAIVFNGNDYVAISTHGGVAGNLAVRADGTLVYLQVDSTTVIPKTGFTNVLTVGGGWVLTGDGVIRPALPLPSESFKERNNVIELFDFPFATYALTADGDVLKIQPPGSILGQITAPYLTNEVANIIGHDAFAGVFLHYDGSFRAHPPEFQRYISNNYPAIMLAGYERNLGLTPEGMIEAMAWSLLSTTNPPPRLSNIVQIASGVSHNVAVVGVGKPRFAPRVARWNVTEGNALNINARATGELPITYQWHFNGQLLPEQTNPSLHVASFSKADEGTYEVTAVNRQGTSSINYQVSSTPLRILDQPQTRDLWLGSDVTFGIIARGKDLKYQWRHNGTNVSGATNVQLAIANAEWSDAGEYQVIVRNEAAEITSESVRLDLSALGSIGIYPPAQRVPTGVSNLVAISDHSARRRDGAVIKWAPAPEPARTYEVIPQTAGEQHPGIIATNNGLALTSDGRVIRIAETSISGAIPAGLREVVELTPALSPPWQFTVTERYPPGG
jgi:hypothetical protein